MTADPTLPGFRPWHLVLLVPPLLAGCGGGDRATEPSPAGRGSVGGQVLPAATEPLPPELEARVEGLIADFTPPEATAVSSARDEWLDRRRARLFELERGDPPLGSALVRTLRERQTLDQAVRRALAEAAATCAPQVAAPYFAELVQNYGEDLGLRETAATWIGRADPELARQVLEPVLRVPPRATYPPAESMLAGWLVACRSLEVDPTEVLALVATDLYREDSVRHLAVRELGSLSTPLAHRTLEAVLVESTGNAYLRRLAAQSAAKSMPQGEACALFERVLNLEADPNMLVFLANLVAQHCP
jgi:hypothetical protein